MRFITFIDRDLKVRRKVSLEDADVYKTRSRVYDIVRYDGNRFFKCESCSLSRMNKVCKRIECNNVVLVKRDQ